VQSIGTPKRGQSAAADAHGESIIEKVKAAIIKRGGSHGIHAMGRVLKIMDDNGNKVLSREELKYGLRDYGIDLSNKQLDAVMTYFDRNHDGTVDIDEFLLGMAPPMNQRRLDLVKAAFDLMDYNQDGTITIEDMKLNVDPTGHDEVKRGKMKPDEWLTKYLNEFETDVKDGIVTWDEWKQYYQNLSASIDNTDFFELMMRNAWHMSGGKGQTANTTNRRVVVTGKDGKQTIQEVKNDLFIGKDDEKAMEQNLRDQGLEFDKMELYAKLDDEKNQFGAQKGKDQFKNRPAARKSSSNNTRPANKAVGRKSARNDGSRRSDNSRNNNRSKINRSRGENKERDDPLKAYRKGRSKKPSKKDGFFDLPLRYAFKGSSLSLFSPRLRLILLRLLFLLLSLRRDPSLRADFRPTALFAGRVLLLLLFLAAGLFLN
jgi:Ca2+-binding EF-hand superfamily protein